MLTDGTRTFEWDEENRLVSVTIGTHRSEYVYDGLGRRVQILEKEIQPDQTTTTSSDKKYLWVGNAIAEERAGTDGGIVVKKFFAQGFIDSDGTKLLYTRDHLGSVRELVDMAQNVRARYDYDPYGRATKVLGDKDSVFLYTGHFWHAQSGLYLTLFRAYDANLGRWLNRDPLAEGGGINLYAYVGNNPINRFDPLGLCPGDFLDHLVKGFFWTLLVIGMVALSEVEIPILVVWALATLATGKAATEIYQAATEANSVEQFWNRAAAPLGDLAGGALGAGYAGIGLSGASGSSASGTAPETVASESGSPISRGNSIRIQNAANRTGQEIIVVGSRANGTATATSDWDYIMSGNSAARHSASSSVPRGSSGGGITASGRETGIDVWQTYNPNAPGYSLLDPTQPYIKFTPKQ